MAPRKMALDGSTKFAKAVVSSSVIGNSSDDTNGFVAAHALPVLYERYEDQVDSFVYNVLEQLQHHYRKLDAGVLSKFPKGKLKGKKYL